MNRTEPLGTVMNTRFSRNTLASAIALTVLQLSSGLAAAQDALASSVEEVTIIGSLEEARKIAGSAHFIGEQQLRQFAYSDVQRIVREVPGVSLQIEDGYGLRPNIGIRGVATERSGRITLLEDNVLIAPAPYSAPLANLLQNINPSVMWIFHCNESICLGYQVFTIKICYWNNVIHFIFILISFKLFSILNFMLCT